MSIKVIVALDFNNQADALALVDNLDPNCCALKVGSELFTLLGPDFVRILVTRQFKVFLDLKFHDIPNTVAKACISAAALGVWMMNVHASGGFDMMQAARHAVDGYGSDRPLIIAVTVLTSMTYNTLKSIGVHKNLQDQVKDLALLSQKAGLDGVVCSALEVPMIKSACGFEFLTVTPGIRLPGDTHDDQKRILTPLEAVNAGSDYLVIGRSITRATAPLEVLGSVIKMIS